MPKIIKTMLGNADGVNNDDKDKQTCSSTLFNSQQLLDIESTANWEQINF